MYVACGLISLRVLQEEEAPAAETEDESQSQEDTKDSSDDYEYLLGMKLWSLTLERKNELLKKRDEKTTELQILQKKSPSDLWVEDLDALLAKVNFIIGIVYERRRCTPLYLEIYAVISILVGRS